MEEILSSAAKIFIKRISYHATKAKIGLEKLKIFNSIFHPVFLLHFFEFLYNTIFLNCFIMFLA